jgi:DNA-binding transcriptional ArsR family regulator
MPRNSEGTVFDALAHSNRRRILRYLRDKDYVRAGDIAEALQLGASTLSGHLKALRLAELVVARRVGTEIQYRANLTVLDELIVMLSGLRGSPPAEDGSTPTPEAADRGLPTRGIPDDV